MTILLKAKHFEGTLFCDSGNCALAKAAKEQLASEYVLEAVSSIEIDRVEYFHKKYGTEEFGKDKRKAEKLNYDETVLRKFRLFKKSR